MIMTTLHFNSNPKELLNLQNIGKKFGDYTAIQDISFKIHEGEIFGFLGPSGAGKTTTIKILTGQLLQSQGIASILGNNTKNIGEEIYEQIGLVTDTVGVYERLTVQENLNIFANILKVDKQEIDKVLKRVDLYENRKQKAGKLSKGQKQRLGLARAVLHKPKILFLDEPTSGLDPATAKHIHSMFLELKKEGVAIFLTTHNMDEATKLCDIVALLNEGHIVEYGTPKELCLRYNDQKSYNITLTNGDTLLLEDTVENYSKINDYFFNEKIASIHSNEPTLEDVFIKVTGRSLES